MTLRRRCPVALVYELHSHRQTVGVLIALAVVYASLVNPLSIVTLEVALNIPSPILLRGRTLALASHVVKRT